MTGSPTDYKEPVDIPMQGIPVPEVVQPTAVPVQQVVQLTAVAIPDEQTARHSKQMIGLSSGICVVALVLVLVTEYYLHLYILKDMSGSEVTDAIVNTLLVISCVLGVVAAVLGSFQIRNLPEGSRKTYRIGIAVVGIVFVVAAVVLFAIWVSPSDDHAPEDNREILEETILFGCIMQIITFAVVVICLCAAFFLANCCTPPTVNIVQVQQQL